MKWTDDAKEMLSRVPFFVRRRVRERVEEEAARCGAKEVTPELMDRCKKRFLNRMEEEVKGHRVESCFGRSGCPNRAVQSGDLSDDLEKHLSRRNLKAFLKDRVQGELKFHHEFRISISDCPNACSQPQIADVGIIGACTPSVGPEPCTACGACVEICREQAILLRDGAPVVDRAKCLHCGQCITACPSGTLVAGSSGHRILVGGKLGRHPRLAEELAGIHDREAALRIIKLCLDSFQKHCRKGERFGEIIERIGSGRKILEEECSAS
ncbi:MAG: sulfite reductase [Deltaproteobacteria bacterium HGW-Deltaproteobacteria-21]|nr:MAG: sulfite reductase [Deltaproteobacteria bacterium HGW-Deltaproteobacteria-21]